MPSFQKNTDFESFSFSEQKYIVCNKTISSSL